MPQRAATAAPKVRLARLLGQMQGFCVHPSDHKHVTCLNILHYRWDQSPFVKFKVGVADFIQCMGTTLIRVLDHQAFLSYAELLITAY
jgi:hypothetical protein